MLCQKDAMVLCLFVAAGTQVPPQLMEEAVSKVKKKGGKPFAKTGKYDSIKV
jgi:hypothetical protein